MCSSDLGTIASVQVHGINLVSASGTNTINNNIIANLSNGNSTTNSSVWIRGIVTSAGVNQINNNVIRNVNTASGNAGTTTLAANIGIQMTSTSFGSSTAPIATTINNNSIHSLGVSHPTSGVQITGIYWSGPAAQTSSNPPIIVDNQVSRNNMHS